MIFLRTCQECGYRQKANPPNQLKPLSEAYRNAKCRKCQSEGFDYGSYFKGKFGPDGKFIDAREMDDR